MASSDDTWLAAARQRAQSGSATVWALGWMGMCAMVGWIGLLLAAVVATHHHLDGSADLASLAGAAALQSGSDACQAVRRTAADNGVHVIACSVRSSDVLVTVEGSVALPFGLPGRLRSTARAGPDDVS